MNYILLLSIVASLLLLELILQLIRKKKDGKLNNKPDRKKTERGSTCLEAEDCWCCEYNLSKEKKEEILKEFGDLHCGGSVGSMLKNE